MHCDTGHLEYLKEFFLINDPSRLGGHEITCSHLLSFFRRTPSSERMTVDVSVGNIFAPITPRVSLLHLRYLYLGLDSGDTEAPDVCSECWTSPLSRIWT